MKKRLLSLLLALVLLAGALPGGALAAGTGSGTLLRSGSTDLPALTQGEIARLLADNPLTMPADVYDAEPSCSAPYAAGAVKPELLRRALGRLNALRRLAGLPAAALNDAWSQEAQYAAVVQAAPARQGDSLSHYPTRPEGMEESFYQKAYAGSSSSNLYAGVELLTAVDGWMDDTDYRNIAALGHRRWQLNPAMQQVGFGYAANPSSTYRYYTAEKVFDGSSSGRALVNYDFIAWPASGWFPGDTRAFNFKTAWSVTLNPAKYATPVQSELTVTLVRQSDGKTWTFSGAKSDPKSEAYFGVSTAGYGGVSNCIVFRPDGISRYDGYDGIYTVRIDGLKTAAGQAADFMYQVDFFQSAKYQDPASAGASIRFSDVSPWDYYAKEVAWAVGQGIINGSGDTFKPNGTCTEADMLTLIWRSMGRPRPTVTVNPFSNVSASAYYYRPALWAYEKGIIPGGTFEPNVPATRGKTVMFLWKANGSPDVKAGSAFSDVPADAEYAPAVEWARQKGIVKGNGTPDSTFNPTGQFTRGDAAVMLYRAEALT